MAVLQVSNVGGRPTFLDPIPLNDAATFECATTVAHAIKRGVPKAVAAKLFREIRKAGPWTVDRAHFLHYALMSYLNAYVMYKYRSGGSLDPRREKLGWV